jgi:hypothetical protein
VRIPLLVRNNTSPLNLILPDKNGPESEKNHVQENHRWNRCSFRPHRYQCHGRCRPDRCYVRRDPGGGLVRPDPARTRHHVRRSQTDQERQPLLVNFRTR